MNCAGKLVEKCSMLNGEAPQPVRKAVAAYYYRQSQQKQVGE